MAGAQDSAALRALSDAVLTITAERSVEPVLQKLVDSVRELAGARYAAVGVPDGEGAFAQFITSGMSDAEIAAMGPLPRTHGLLGAMLETPTPFRAADIRQDPRFRGWWPSAHPEMRSFLGVPIVASEGIVGAFYLTDKLASEEFSVEDERLISLFAAHAAVALENARLHERSRELSVVEERDRLARDLHDSVTQRLFGVVLTAEAAATLLDRDVGAARDQLSRLQREAREAMEELRSLVLHLRPPALEREGLAATLRKHADVLRRADGPEITLTLGATDLDAEVEVELYRVAQEALQNALRHANASSVALTLSSDDAVVRLTVSDDGSGFETSAPDVRSRRLGLTTMEERARRAGGRLTIETAPGEGTTVRLEVSR